MGLEYNKLWLYNEISWLVVRKVRCLLLIDRREEAQKRIQLSAAGANQNYPRDFKKIKIGAKALDNAILDFGVLKKANSRYGDKNYIIQCLNNLDYN